MHPIQQIKTIKFLDTAISKFKLTPWIVRILLNNDRARVANISDEKVSAVREYANTGRATVTDVCPHVAHFIICLLEPNCHRGVHLVERRILQKIMVLQMPLQLVFDEHWESMLQEGANFAAIRAVAIANREEMAVL